MAFCIGSGLTVIARSLSRLLDAPRARSPACARSISSCAARLTCTRADSVEVIGGARGGGVGVTTFSGGGRLSWGGGARVTTFSGGGLLSWGGGARVTTFSGGGPLSWGGGARETTFSGGGPLSWGGGARETTFSGGGP